MHDGRPESGSVRPDDDGGLSSMAFVTTDDGAEIYYKDWGSADAQPIMFHHGWPLSADDWDAQMLYFLDRATGWSRATDGATGGPPRSAPATTWTTTPATSTPWSGTSTCATPSTSATRPVAGRSRATSPSTASPGPRGEGRPGVVRAPADGADRGQPGRHARLGLRRVPQRAGGQPGRVLRGRGVGPVLRVQPPRAPRSPRPWSTTGGARG